MVVSKPEAAAFSTAESTVAREVMAEGRAELTRSSRMSCRAVGVSMVWVQGAHLLTRRLNDLIAFLIGIHLRAADRAPPLDTASFFKFNDFIF
jgi:hypothetical protein